jgi:hypothetical protein
VLKQLKHIKTMLLHHCAKKATAAGMPNDSKQHCTMQDGLLFLQDTQTQGQAGFASSKLRTLEHQLGHAKSCRQTGCLWLAALRASN